MNSLASKMKVMNLLGTGLSVRSLCERADISFDELCKLAEEYPELHRELKRWYKRYEFTPKKEIPVVKHDKSLETKTKSQTRKNKSDGEVTNAETVISEGE